MSLLRFPFVDMELKFSDGSSGNLEQPLSLDSFLTGVLFEPYLNSELDFQDFNLYMEMAFKNAGNLSSAHNVLRDVYYARLRQWYEDHHLAIVKAQCHMCGEPSAMIIFALRTVCEEVDGGSVALKNYMTHKNLKLSNHAIVYKEAANMMSSIRVNYRSASLVFELFGYLFSYNV